MWGFIKKCFFTEITFFRSNLLNVHLLNVHTICAAPPPSPKNKNTRK